MYPRFTPSAIIKQRQQKFIAGVLFAAVLFTSVYHFLAASFASANTVVTWGGDSFPSGVTAGTSIFGGTVRLASSGGGSQNDDFSHGNINSESLALSAVIDSGVTLGSGYYYDNGTTPAITGNRNGHVSVLGEAVYISVGSNLSVLNTGDVHSPTDDFISATYNEFSTPAFPYVDSEVSRAVGLVVPGPRADLFYIATPGSGVVLLDTNATIDQADDTLITLYSADTAPVSLPNNDVTAVAADGDLVYIATQNGGVLLIDTKGTASNADDELLFTYRNNTVPAISDNMVNVIKLEGDILYVGTDLGLSVIDTKGTPSPADDELIINYTIASSPSLPNIGFNPNSIYSVEYDLVTGLLFIGGRTSGVAVIDTKLTVTAADDEVMGSYLSTDILPTTSSNTINDLFFEDGLLYVNSVYGVSVIDINDSVTISDDILLYEYLPIKSAEFFTASEVGSLFVADGVIYILSNQSFIIINPDQFSEEGVFVGLATNIASTSVTEIAVSANITGDHDIVMEYQTGNAGAAFREDFDENNLYAGDLYMWGTPFNTSEIIDGVLTLSDPASEFDTAFWLDLGVDPGYFEAGSEVTARVRLNTNNDETYFVYSFDEEWFNYDYTEVSNDWVILKFKPEQAFANIGFSIYPLISPTEIPMDATFEIDWIQVETDPGMGFWNTWQTCPSYSSCELDSVELDGAEWLRYRLNLSTTNPASSPLVTQVSYLGGGESTYEASGVFTSDSLNLEREQTLETFGAVDTVSASTSITYEYTINNGATWLPITPGAAFPAGTRASTFSWRATLETTDSTITPVITSISLTYVSGSGGNRAGSGTSLPIRVALLEQQGKFDEAKFIIDNNPGIFGNSSSTVSYNDSQLKIKFEIIKKAEEVVNLLSKLIKLKAQE